VQRLWQRVLQVRLHAKQRKAAISLQSLFSGYKCRKVLLAQHAAAIGNAAANAREHIKGMGVLAAEKAATRLEGVAQNIREHSRGNQSSHQSQDVDDAQDMPTSVWPRATGRMIYTCPNLQNQVALHVNRAQEAATAGLPMSWQTEKELSVAETAGATAEVQAAGSAVSLTSDATQALGSSATLPLQSSMTLPVEPLASEATSLAYGSCDTLPVGALFQPSSNISLASTVMVASGQHVAPGIGDKEESNSQGATPPVSLDAEEMKTEGSSLRAWHPEHPGAAVEVFDDSCDCWRVGRIGFPAEESTSRDEVLVDLLDMDGGFTQKRLRRDDVSLAALGTHVHEAPPGFESRPSASRPGMLTYVNKASGASYRCAEHAWQEYFGSLTRLMQAGTVKVLPEPPKHVGPLITVALDTPAEKAERPCELQAPHPLPTPAMITTNFNAVAIATTAAIAAPLPPPLQPMRAARVSAPPKPQEVIGPSVLMEPQPPQQPYWKWKPSVIAPPAFPSKPVAHGMAPGQRATAFASATSDSVPRHGVPALQPAPNQLRIVRA